MPGENVIAVEGVVKDALPNGTYRVELSNGHRLLGFVTRRDKALCEGLAAGMRVRLKLSPCDLSRGRIAGKA